MPKRPRREWLSFACFLRCNASRRISSDNIAICISADPESGACDRCFSMILDFCFVFNIMAIIAKNALPCKGGGSFHAKTLTKPMIYDGKSPELKTIENYDRYLLRFLTFSGARNPADITDEVVRKYRLHLNRGAGEGGAALKKQTQAYHLIALRNFLKFLSRRDVKTLAAEKIELGKMPSHEVSFLEGDELERLLRVSGATTLSGLRDRAMLELLFSTGLRVSELCALNRASVNLSRDEFSVKGKGDKMRVVFLSDAAKTALTEYLKKRDDVDEAMFVSVRAQDKKDT